MNFILPLFIFVPMRIVIISDTHGCHREAVLPEGDIIVHTGDICNQGNEEQVHDFLDWYKELDYQRRIFIKGNHDWDLINNKTLIPSEIPSGIDYLHNESLEINGVKIWGVGEDNDKDAPWDLIPNDTDILLTHSPPFEILDKAPSGNRRGEKALLKRVFEVAPRLHLFGHIHFSHGREEQNGIQFFNSSLFVALERKLGRQPFYFDW